MERTVDLVCPWVDGNDRKWQEERAKYLCGTPGESDTFFRDYELMRYWFRGVEKALPWIRKVHFVTWGHLPQWLNIDHPKLNIVRHEDFMPTQYLPVFSSSPITINIHRIKGLSENFIFTNDDFFYLDYIPEEEYFRDGLPCDYIELKPITEVDAGSFGHVLWNDIDIINNNFDLQSCVENSRDKWFSREYPEKVLNSNEIYKYLKRFPGFAGQHLPSPYCKSTFDEVWEKAGKELDISSKNRFRSSYDVNEWLMRYWQLTSGRFVPHKRELGKYVQIGADAEKLSDAILSAKNKVVCINEGGSEVNFEERKEYLRSLFEIALPEKSSYELF